MMKLRKTLSAVVLGVGCAAAFIGLLSLLLPAIANDQLRLVLSSFEMPSKHPVVNAMNRCMSFSLSHAWQVLISGGVTAVVGGILFSLFLKEEPKRRRDDLYRRPSHVPKPQPVTTEPAEAPDPFADMELWNRAVPARREEPVFQENHFPVFNPAPILEPNRIEEAEEPIYTYQPEPEPFLPEARTPVSFQFEKQAIETETSLPSQSGSRAILRSSFPVLEEEIAPEPEPEEVIAQPLQTADDPYADDPRFEPNEEEPPPPPPVSSRIRSTMGKHTC